MDTKQIRVDPETADYLATTADEVGMPRPAFLRLLARRYGDALRLELSSPVRLAPGDLQVVTRDGNAR